MHREIMCYEDNLNRDNVGNAMLNLSDVMEDMEGLKSMLMPFNDVNENEFIPHIVRSLETFISDINEVHNYLDRICLNSVKSTDIGNMDSRSEGRC